MMHHVPNSQHCPLCSVQQLAKAVHAKQTPHERALTEKREMCNNASGGRLLRAPHVCFVS